MFNTVIQSSLHKDAILLLSSIPFIVEYDLSYRLDLYKKDKPIFLDIGGEFAMPFTSSKEEMIGFSQFFNNLSKKHDAALLWIEHRYFGWDEIFSNVNQVKKLQWLTIE